MKLENQVCSLELAQKLKSLGVKQESYFEWGTTQNGLNVSLGETLKPDHRNYNSPFYRFYSAFTCSELGEMLPEGFTSSKRRNGAGYECYLFNDKMNTEPTIIAHKFADTEADARAKMLIYLIENNLITI